MRELHSPELRNAVIAALDPPVLALMEAVEEAAGGHIQVWHEQHNPRKNPAISVSHAGVVLAIRNPSDIGSQEVLHELLHAKRYIIDGIPKLIAEPCVEPNASMLAEIDNNLEHLAIVPLEEQYGYEPYDYWTNLARAGWDDFPWGQTGSTLRRVALAHSMALPLIKDEALYAAIHDKMAAAGLAQDLHFFERVLRGLVHHKQLQTYWVLKALGIPSEQIRFYYPTPSTQTYRILMVGRPVYGIP